MRNVESLAELKKQGKMRIEKDKLYMAEECRSFEKTVPVSRRMYKQVNQKFIDYNRKQED